MSSVAPSPAQTKPARSAPPAELGMPDGSSFVRVIVTLRDQVVWQDFSPVQPSGIVETLQARAQRSWEGLADRLVAAQNTGQARAVQRLWIINGLTLDASPEFIKEMVTWPEVQQVDTVHHFSAPHLLPGDVAAPALLDVQPDALPAINLRQVRAPDLWSVGFQGSGVVVANMDTGVDGGHPDLAPGWRGGDNSWYDPHGEHPDYPVDMNGHGTAVMGIMTGGEASGQALGIAPQARWIAVKIFNDRGISSSDIIHAGFQWLLDPDGDPETLDSPHVVVLSWVSLGTGCDLEFEPDLEALRAAGILPIFAAGNFGPAPASSRSPANNPGAFAVGALSAAGEVLALSSRGPSACSGDLAYPDLASPGEAILTMTRGGGYATFSGTSMAAPHVGGGLALLLDAFPGLSAADQEAALQSGAYDLGLPGVDNESGYGRLDLFSTYRWLAQHQVPPSPPPPPVIDDIRLFLPKLILH